MRQVRSENGGPTTQERPPILAPNGIHVLGCREDVEARKILEQYARSSFDSLKLWPPKSYFFSPFRRCVIAYAVANNIAICLGDPVGPDIEIEMTAREFLKKCKKKRWGVAFYRTSADFLPVYRRLGLQKLKIGDDALVDLGQFSLNGRSKRDIRSKANHFQQLGMRVVEYQPPLASETLAQLTNVEEQWLTIPGRRERTFAVGHFDQGYLRATPVLAVIDCDGKIFAFVNVISANPGEIAGDVMRRSRDAPNGITDYLLLKLIQYAREKRCNRVSLGLAPMTGFKEGESARLEERVINGVLRKLDFLFRFRGLSLYKAKFATSSEPRYLIYENLLQLPRAALALVRLSEIKDRESLVRRSYQTLTNSSP
ncbi:MAG TPA: phosphatidylglycerol lysyltransferase domain-containing protein [Terriglobales bacterium]|nr:phosphatidylglycerol lysyltransferase domain-containing protein [Terriglobales bacterium]